MKNNEFREILKKCFGKQKDEKYHAVAMLAIYGIFILILVVCIRMGGNSSNMIDNPDSINPDNNIPSSTVSPSDDEDVSLEDDTDNDLEDVNYSYSYTVTYNGTSEVYLGKRINDKQKFTLIKDGVSSNYAILSDNYLILENNLYHITESPSKFFKYCDVDEILALVENEISVESGNTVKYNISNSVLAKKFSDELTVDNEQNNSIVFTLSGDELKNIDLDLSNYFTSIENTPVTLTIHMEFVDIGTTENFEIKVS